MTKKEKLARIQEIQDEINNALSKLPELQALMSEEDFDDYLANLEESF